MARIAVLGWGSLIWNRDTLATRTSWHSDGPCLPVEFARHSNGDRVTLVLIPGYMVESRAYWAMSAAEDLFGAAENLRIREGCPTLKPIHAADGHRAYSVGDGNPPPDGIARIMVDWLESRTDIDAVVWTGLRPKGFETNQPNELAEDVVAFLIANPNDEAKQYVEMAPPTIDTVRRTIEGELGWGRVPLDPSLLADHESGDPCRG